MGPRIREREATTGWARETECWSKGLGRDSSADIFRRFEGKFGDAC